MFFDVFNDYFLGRISIFLGRISIFLGRISKWGRGGGNFGILVKYTPLNTIQQHNLARKQRIWNLNSRSLQHNIYIVYVAVYFRAIFMYTPIFLCFQVLKGPKNAKISAADFWKVGKVNFWPL